VDKGNVGLCRDLYNVFIEKVIPNLKISDVVIISISWPYYPNGPRDSDLVNSLREEFMRLKDTQATIIIFGSSPSFSRAPQAISVRQKKSNHNEIYLESGDVEALNKFLEGEANRFGYKFFDPSKAMCKDGNFKFCLVKRDGRYLYLDHGHLSEYGSIYVMHKLWSIYEKQFSSPIR
jgi:hypothetical protein